MDNVLFADIPTIRSRIRNFKTYPPEDIRFIARLPYGLTLVYAQGSFDKWCIYVKDNNDNAVSPLDRMYFNYLQNYQRRHPECNLYQDFCFLYERTGLGVEQEVLDYIKHMVFGRYYENPFQIYIDFCILYAGMIAEENKEGTMLGKRVKRLGMYQILVEDMPAEDAANFSKGKGWREIDSLCRERGF